MWKWGYREPRRGRRLSARPLWVGHEAKSATTVMAFENSTRFVQNAFETIGRPCGPIGGRAVYPPQRGTSWYNPVPMPPFSLNVPIPGRVHAVVADLEPALVDADRIRSPLSLVVKRLGDRPSHELDTRVRDRLRGAAPFEVAVTGVNAFREPAAGPGPVVYLSIAGPELHRIHGTLCETIDPVPGIEGTEYVPHITLARGLDPATLDRLQNAPIETTSWTVNELLIWDAEYDSPSSRIHLPI